MNRYLAEAMLLVFVAACTAVGMIGWIVEGPRRIHRQLRCKLGWHNYDVGGWAERRCLWCFLHEAYIYEDGTSQWESYRW